MILTATHLYTRKLTAEDEEQFIQLLKAVYGLTYSYRFLYEVGGFSSLINNKSLTSYGEFDGDHRLLGHTGFWHKEKNSDYVESGCSFRLAAGSSEFKAKTLPIDWQTCLYDLALEYTFIHQQCSTSHSLAQRYALQFMNAKACGVILGYAQNEQVRGVEFKNRSMHALMMTSILQPESISEKSIYLPEQFHPWLKTIYEDLNLPRNINPVAYHSMTQSNINLVTIETNSYISMHRRLVVAHDSQVEQNFGMHSLFENNTTPFRTDLIHLPIESPDLVVEVLPRLIELGYMPCGLRPHVYRSDELILQNIKGYQHVVVNLMNEIKIADKNTKLWVELWQRLTLQIM